jgi:hypothetical protein
MSPLTTPHVFLGSKFHTPKEIGDHTTATGKLSPFSLISSPEKEKDENGKKVPNLGDLARQEINRGGSGSANSINPLNL